MNIKLIMPNEPEDQAIAHLVLKNLSTNSINVCENVTPEALEKSDILLKVQKNILSINVPSLNFSDFYLDFNAGRLSYRKMNLSSTSELLLKAIGYKKNQPPSVIDAMAGWGRDAFIMVSAGCHVTSLEKSSLIYHVLANAIKRWQSHQDSWQLMHCQCETFLNALKDDQMPDVIYLDPMFPEAQHAAKAKKEAQLLQFITSLEDNQQMPNHLIDLALSKAKKRVVVKRPLKSAFLGDITANFMYKGKAIRFDVYPK